MAFASARTRYEVQQLGAGRAVRDSGMGNLDDLLDLLGCQLAALLHREPGGTALAGKPTILVTFAVTLGRR
jgi:hypothetical protein